MTGLNSLQTDVLVLGSGIAGGTAALTAARSGASVILATAATEPTDTTTDWAQGGIATTRVGPEEFKRDILEASDGTADPGAVDVLVEEASAAIEDILIDELDIAFDRSGEEFDYHREAAHSTARILHTGTRTGRHILRPLLQELSDHPQVELLTDTPGTDLLVDGNSVCGARVWTDAGPRTVHAGSTILATGGVGGLYPRSTNPTTATGDGVAMAALAGAEISETAFVQFHPTAIDTSMLDTGQQHPTALISEAVRGAGAVLRDGEGTRFMPDIHPDEELAPRDVVSRAVEQARKQTGEVRLDVSDIAFETKFPALYKLCRNHGIDPSMGIPVAPCEHFLCGGVDVDTNGQTSLDSLYAVGECARTGVHGANRLASTSLLEGLVWGRRAGSTAAADTALSGTPVGPELPRQDPSLPSGFTNQKLGRVQRILGEHLGVRRTEDGIEQAQQALRRLKGEVDAYRRTRRSQSLSRLHLATVTALLIADDAATQSESVGCHYLEQTVSSHAP